MIRFVLLAPALAALVVGSASTATPLARPAAPLENRCGWLHNPTPANWWLTDREREWVIGTQGGRQAPGWDAISYDPSEHEWIETNGGYGHGCACARMQLDHRTGTVLRIASITARPLAACRADRTLPRP